MCLENGPPICLAIFAPNHANGNNVSVPPISKFQKGIFVRIEALKDETLVLQGRMQHHTMPKTKVPRKFPLRQVPMKLSQTC